MSEKKPLDLFTMPNATTFFRLVISRKMAKRLGNDPAGTWPSTAVYVATDVIDGLEAKGGEWLAKKFKALSFLPRIGFRKSELGRKMDPFTDKIVISQMVKEGMDKDIIPRPLAYAALAQKAIVSAHTLHAEAQGVNLEVSDFGRHSELLSNLGFGMLFAAEGIENPLQKSLARGAFVTAAALGVIGAGIATAGYVQDAREQLAQQPAGV